MDLSNFELEKAVLNRYKTPDAIDKGYYLRVRERSNHDEIKVYYGGIKVFEVYNNSFIINPSIFIPNSKNVFEGIKEENPTVESENKLSKTPVGTKYQAIKEYRFIDKFQVLKDPENPDKLKHIEKDMHAIDTYFNFTIGSNLKGTNKYKIGLELTVTALKEPEEVIKKVVEEIKREAQKYSHIISSIELSELNVTKKSKNRYLYMFLKDDISNPKKDNRKQFTLTELYDMFIWLLNGVLCNWIKTDGKRYFKSLDLNIIPKAIQDNASIFKDITEIENILERRVKVYTGAKINDKDYNPEADYNISKPENNQEKQYQQNFMGKLSAYNKPKTMYINHEGTTTELYSENLYPFELEYVLYAGKPPKEDESSSIILEEEKRGRNNIKGRIDNTFVDGTTAVLVEIKYGCGVIGGQNGIHKHLIDLYSCLNCSQEEIKTEYQSRVNLRREKMGLEGKMTIKDIRYDIVCIYNSTVADESDLSKKAVQDRIREIYDIPAKTVIEGTDKKTKLKLCNCIDINNICKDVNNYCNNLVNKSVPELIECLKNDCLVNVNIILVDEIFTKYEEYIHKN